MNVKHSVSTRASDSSPEPPDDAVLARIRSLLTTLRPSEQRVARVFLDDVQTAATLPIGEVARMADTSTTTVVRFYRSFGFTQYKDFRIAIVREAYREQLVAADLPDVGEDVGRDDAPADIIAKIAVAETHSIADTAEVLDPEQLSGAIAALRTARRVDVFGLSASAVVALDLQQKLTRIGRTALTWTDAHQAWTAAATLDDSCVAIGVSHSGVTPEVLHFLTVAAAGGARTLAITNAAGSPLAEQADFVLATSARESGFRSGALGSRIAQLMVVDCLFIGLAQATYEESTAAVRATYRAVHGARDARRPEAL